jgi:hypothetical protein
MPSLHVEAFEILGDAPPRREILLNYQVTWRLGLQPIESRAGLLGVRLQMFFSTIRMKLLAIQPLLE